MDKLPAKGCFRILPEGISLLHPIITQQEMRKRGVRLLNAGEKICLKQEIFNRV